MIRRVKGTWTLSTVVMLMVASAGCEALHNAGVPGLEGYVKKDPVLDAKEKSCRENFVVHRDHKSFYWLLSHLVHNGMNRSEVEYVLGEEGEETDEFTRLKSDGLYQTTDAAYRWGPDNAGRSAIIFFRDGHVINFEPADYKPSSELETGVSKKR